jgi:hypothetical protein
MPSSLRLILGLLFALLLAACDGGRRLEPPELQGYGALVDDGGQPRLWLLTRQEETRESRNPSRRGVSSRKLVLVHFDLHAFDPDTARPLWTRRVHSFKAQDGLVGPVVGGTVRGRLLGQDGDRVWLVIGRDPHALAASDGRTLDDAAGIVARHPALEGMLPEDPQRYGFDRGLVFMTADARQHVVRGAEGARSDYVPPQAPVKAPSHEDVKVPLRPYGEAPLRLVEFNGRRLGLYSAAEAESAANDRFGRQLAYPYSVLDQGALARRSLWWAEVETVAPFDEPFERLSAMTPVPGSPEFLRGRFASQPGRDLPLVPPGEPGLLVWHNTRIDRAGRLALTRLDAALAPAWTVELPLSDAPAQAHLATRLWALPGRLLAVGELATSEGERVQREVHVVSVDPGTGEFAAWNLQRGAPP